jgi:hypothetical protein
MSLYGPFPVSMINIMTMLINLCYQQEQEAVVGNVLQEYLLIAVIKAKILVMQAGVV